MYMIVKKKNPAWQPSENPGLKVGETIEITDPKSLILAGYVVAVDEQGAEIPAYDLYGVIIADEKKEFEDYIKMKRLQAQKAILEKQQAELKAQLPEEKKEEKVEKKK